jgi:hypothetical protein
MAHFSCVLHAAGLRDHWADFWAVADQPGDPTHWQDFLGILEPAEATCSEDSWEDFSAAVADLAEMTPSDCYSVVVGEKEKTRGKFLNRKVWFLKRFAFDNVIASGWRNRLHFRRRFLFKTKFLRSDMF